MYDCPACGGNLKFDIDSQQLFCGYCNAKYDPYQITKDKDGEEQTDYEVTVFTCPQCGGEILSTDNTAAGFCSFCGASTILTSRISREKKPNFIIPFKKTKEDCKREYQKLMRRFIYAPAKLKNTDQINGFRGIYMPYWVYYFSQKGTIKLNGTQSHRSGDYIITEHYNLTGDLDAYYKGISYDGSSSFSDRISESIAPFDVKNMKEFTPSMLSGFYADTTDIGKDLYIYDAEAIANDETKEFIKKEKAFKKYDIKMPSDISRRFNTKTESVDMAMFPVWFMSYKNGDRVSYATINGQTGKIFADLPVSIPKYLAGAGILAIPIFILLNMFLTIIPTTLVSVVAVIAAIVGIIYAVELSKIAKKENDEDDKGKQEANRLARIRKEKEEREAARAAGVDVPYVYTNNNKQKKKKEKKEGNKKTILFIMIMLMMTLSVVAQELHDSLDMLDVSGGGLEIGIVLLSLVTAIVTYIKNRKDIKRIDAKKGFSAILWIIISDVLAIIVGIMAPAEDIYYYVMVILMLISVGVTLIDLIGCYNIFATRKLPQFDYQGGDDNA